MNKLSAEETLIGELILEGNQTPEVYSILPDGSFFQDKKCAEYYEAILETYDKHGQVDFILIMDYLKKRNLNDSFLYELSDRVDHYGKVSIHAKRVAEKYMKRIASLSLIELNKDFQDNPDVFEAIDTTIGTLTHIRSQFRKDHAVSLATVAGETCDEIEKYRKGNNPSLPFGFVDIDCATGGMEKGDLIVIAGLEKRGKSTLAIQTMFYNAQRKTPCLFFSTEMKRKQIMFRYALIVENLSWIKVKQNKLTSLEWEKLIRRVNILGSLPIYVRDDVVTISDIMSEAERFVSDRGVQLIVVDYIQRVVPIGKKSNENREREIASISSGLKNIAFKNDIPVIALSQLNDDLRARESRAIEQDMDKMVIINSEDKDELNADLSGATIGIRIRQRMGLSGGFNESKLFYDRLNGSWKSSSMEDRYSHETETQISF
jgi:replicative DNA helicase